MSAMRTDFQKAFQAGYSFQYDMCSKGIQTVEFSVIDIGKLKVSSGFIVAQDIGWPIHIEYDFTKAIPPGNYPVILSLAGFSPVGERRIACAKIQVSDYQPVKWQTAVIQPGVSEQEQGYGVDSGTGCFMDRKTAHLLKQQICNDSALNEEGNLDDYESSDDLVKKQRESFFNKISMKMKRNSESLTSKTYKHDRRGGWVNICICKTSDENVVVFSSGWGDGNYYSYWGYDHEDNICCLVTDFLLFKNSTDILV